MGFGIRDSGCGLQVSRFGLSVSGFRFRGSGSDRAEAALPGTVNHHLQRLPDLPYPKFILVSIVGIFVESFVFRFLREGEDFGFRIQHLQRLPDLPSSPMFFLLGRFIRFASGILVIGFRGIK